MYTLTPRTSLPSLCILRVLLSVPRCGQVRRRTEQSSARFSLPKYDLYVRRCAAKYLYRFTLKLQRRILFLRKRRPSLRMVLNPTLDPSLPVSYLQPSHVVRNLPTLNVANICWFVHLTENSTCPTTLRRFLKYEIPLLSVVIAK